MLRALKVAALVTASLVFLLLGEMPRRALLHSIPLAESTSEDANAASQAQKVNDPAAWGSNHVGKPVPEFVHGDECLFCHRNDIGPGWQKNAHGLTIRQNEDAPEFRDVMKGQATLSGVSPQVEYFMGSRHRLRFLK